MTSRQAASTFTIERLLGPLHGQESLTYTDISEDESEEEEETSADNDEASIIRQALLSRHYVDCVRVSVQVVSDRPHTPPAQASPRLPD